MSKRAFDKIARGLNEAIAFADGTGDAKTYQVHVPAEFDVRALRKKTGLGQADFAARYGFGLARLRDWEQGRSRPDSAMRAYLLVIEREREAVDKALHAA